MIHARAKAEKSRKNVVLNREIIMEEKNTCFNCKYCQATKLPVDKFLCLSGEKGIELSGEIIDKVTVCVWWEGR